jgi:hypothetical protein
MFREGLYRAAFQTPLGAGAGIVYASGGKMWGGDSAIYYVGTYSDAGGQFTASVTTGRHTPGLGSVFGIDRVHIDLRGSVESDTVTLQGRAIEAPNVAFQVILTKISDQN